MVIYKGNTYRKFVFTPIFLYNAIDRLCLFLKEENTKYAINFVVQSDLEKRI